MLFLLAFAFSLAILPQALPYELIYAVNAGGSAHTASDGITYTSDTITEGQPNIFATNVTGVPTEDATIYHSSRYDTTTFGMDLPATSNGNYVLIIKFCEKWQTAVGAQIFDVTLNRKHKVLTNFDLFRQVGHGVAHDEYIYFSICEKRLRYKYQEFSAVQGGRIRLDFVKSQFGNPYFNAISLYRGDIEDVPTLPESINAQHYSVQQLKEHRCNGQEMKLTHTQRSINVYNSSLVINNA